VAKNIVILQGHPDGCNKHLCHLLAGAYEKGAKAAGHSIKTIDVASLEFPYLRSKDDWENGETPAGLLEAQKLIFWSDHLVIIYPLWLGTVPAVLKAFFEQVLRPTLTKNVNASPLDWRKLLKGRSARVVVTMGMPAFVFRWYYGSHGLKMLKRNILGFVGISPVRSTIVGLVDLVKDDKLTKLTGKLEALGQQAR